MIHRIFAAVERLERDSQVVVSFDDIDLFLSVCDAVGITACGGAFLSDMSGQYFYKEYRRVAV